MVRRGSTVRVRQRALQKRRTSAPFRSERLAPPRMCSGYGAVYGALTHKASTSPVSSSGIAKRRAILLERAPPDAATEAAAWLQRVVVAADGAGVATVD